MQELRFHIHQCIHTYIYVCVCRISLKQIEYVMFKPIPTLVSCFQIAHILLLRQILQQVMEILTSKVRTNGAVQKNWLLGGRLWPLFSTKDDLWDIIVTMNQSCSLNMIVAVLLLFLLTVVSVPNAISIVHICKRLRLSTIENTMFRLFLMGLNKKNDLPCVKHQRLRFDVWRWQVFSRLVGTSGADMIVDTGANTISKN